MDVTFIISAVIFTLFAIVVATALFAKSSGFSKSSTSRETAVKQSAGGGLVDRSVHNVAAGQRKQQAALSTDRRSSQDHVCEEESHPDPLTEELGTTTTIEQQQSTTSTLSSGQEPGSSLAAEELETTTTAAAAATAEQSTPTLPACISLDPVDSSSVRSERAWASPGGRGQGSYIGLSDTELLKCAFSHSQADGPPESLGILDDTEFKYIPGAVRTQQMQSMMSQDELEEERRVQREQLAAIFQLLKENQETFGEVSEGDMEQQLKLYSI